MDDLTIRRTSAARARMTFSEFAAFYMSRPNGERWELIDGEAIKVAPPTLVHQAIAENICDLLKKRLKVLKSDRRAMMDVGVHVLENEDYSPEPDVVVIDRKIELGQIWAERFYFAVEILSDDSRTVQAKKRAFYSGHAHCFGFMFVRQDEIGVELSSRGDDGWHTHEVNNPDAMIELPMLGKIGRLNKFYETTPLDGAS